MAARAGLPLAPARSSWLSAWPFGTRCGTEPFPTLSTSHEGPVSLATSADQARASLGIRLRDMRRDAGLSGTQLARLADLIAAVRSIETQFAEWRRIMRGGTRRRQQASAAAYERARLFRIYEPAVVPGLLQTHDYAVAVLSTFIDFVRVPDDADEGAAARLERQRVLTHGDRHFHMLLGEQALHTNVGGPEVMTGSSNTC